MDVPVCDSNQCGPVDGYSQIADLDHLMVRRTGTFQLYYILGCAMVCSTVLPCG